MTDIANVVTTGIAVDSTPVVTATKALDDMALSATKLSGATSETERALANFNKAVAGGLSDQLAWSGLTKIQQELLMANSDYAAQLAATNIVLTGTFNEDTIAVVENTAALQVNSLAIREMLVLPREALVGNYTRMAGSASLLAQSLGLLTAETLPLIVGFAAMAAPVIALGVAYVMGSEKVAAFNREMQLTNDYTGLTYGKFQTLAKVIGDDTGTGIDKATQALNVFIKDGNVVGENLQNWADSAVRFGQLSGESSKNAAEEMDKLAGGGVAALIKFQDQYHLLDAALIQHIAQLEATGQKEQEARDIAAGVHEAIRAKGIAELGILQAAWQGFGNLITNVWNNLENIGKNAPPEAKLAEVQNRLKPGFLGMSDVGTSFEAGDRGAIASYQTQIDANNKAATTQSQNAIVQTEAADAVGRMASEWKNVEKNTTMAAQEVAKYKADLAAMSAAHLALPSQDEQDRTIAALNKRYGNHDPKVPKTDAEKYSDKTDKTNTEAAATLKAADAYLISDAAGMQYEARIKALGDATDKKNLTDEEAARIQANLNEIEAKAILSIDKKTAQLVEHTALQKAANDQVAAGTLTSAQAAVQVKQEIELAPLWATLADSKATSASRSAAALAIYNKEMADANANETDNITKLQTSTEAQVKANTQTEFELTLVNKTNEQRAVAIAQFKELEILKNLKIDPKSSEGSAALNAATTGAQDQYALNLSKSIPPNFIQQQSLITDQIGLLSKAMLVAGADTGQLNVQMVHLQQLQLQLNAQKSGNWVDAMNAGLYKLLDTGKTVSQQLSENFTQFFSKMEDGVAKSIGSALTGTKSWGQALHDVATSALSDLIAGMVKMGEQWLIQQAFGKIAAATTTATTLAAQTTLAPVLATNAMNMSVITMGAADAAGMAGFTAAQGMSKISAIPGLAAGGPVVGPGGPTEDKVLIAASNGEYVVNAAATAANRGTLDAINSGGQPANQNHFAAGGVVGGGGGTVIHVDFSGANFSGSDPAAIMQKVDEAMRTVYAPAIVQTSVRQSAGVQKHIAARQHINGKSR